MGDLTEVTMQMCWSIDGPRSFHMRGYEQRGLFSEQHTPTCSCPAYTYSRATPQCCKHIRRIEAEACGWHEQFSATTQTEPGVCPKCEGPTVTVRAAV